MGLKNKLIIFLFVIGEFECNILVKDINENWKHLITHCLKSTLCKANVIILIH